MTQYFTKFFQAHSSLTVMIPLALALIGFTFYAVKQKKRRKKEEQTRHDAVVNALKNAAQKLSAITSTSPLPTRIRAGRMLEQFRLKVTKLGLDPDAFIALPNQATLRQIAEAARKDNGLRASPSFPAPIEAVPTVFAPTPEEQDELALFMGDTDTEVTDKYPEIPAVDTQSFDHTLFVDDDVITSVFTRDSIGISALRPEVNRALGTSTQTVNSSESGQILFFEETPGEGVRFSE